MIDIRKMKSGDTITYRLREQDKPVHPEKDWKGIVLKVSLLGVIIQCLDDGYQDFKDLVFFEQVVHVEREE